MSTFKDGYESAKRFHLGKIRDLEAALDQATIRAERAEQALADLTRDQPTPDAAPDPDRSRHG